MKLDAELDLWREQWQSSSEAPALSGLSKRVARQTLYMRIMLMADILVTLVIGGGAIAWAVQDPRTETAILAAATWLFIAVAWIFGLSNRKDAWSPAASTTAAFLDLSLRRCRGNLRAITFGAILYFCEMAFCLSWVFHDLSHRKSLSLSSFLTSTLVSVVWLCTLFFVAFLLWYRKKKRADLAYLLNLQRDLQTE
jgi:cbb3-type cytochrome oxidase subunit 3